MDHLHEAALIAVRDCLNVQESETVLILTDEPCRKIGRAIFHVCQDLAKEAIFLEIKPRRINGEEPPPAIGKLTQAMDVVICPASTSFTHTEARRNACQAGTRVGTLPGINEDIMIRTMRADYHQIARLTVKVAEILSEGEVAHLTTPLGTDIQIPISGIPAIPSTGLIKEPGKFGNLPSGEAYLMPREGEAEGVYIIDGSMAGIGMIKEKPIKITIEKGMAIRIEGAGEADKLQKMINSVGEQALNLAELGVGTNYMAKITGTILEDEKVLGTVHLALGNNMSMGGTVNVSLHVDGILTQPTLRIDDTLLLDKGNLIVEI